MRSAEAATSDGGMPAGDAPWTMGAFVDRVCVANETSSSTADDAELLLFDRDGVMAAAPELHERAAVQELLLEEVSAVNVLSIGSERGGVPFLYQPAAWLELVSGAKTWWLAPEGGETCPAAPHK